MTLILSVGIATGSFWLGVFQVPAHCSLHQYFTICWFQTPYWIHIPYSIYPFITSYTFEFFLLWGSCEQCRGLICVWTCFVFFKRCTKCGIAQAYTYLGTQSWQDLFPNALTALEFQQQWTLAADSAIVSLCLPPCHSYPTGAEVGIALVLIYIPLKAKGVEHVVRFIDHLRVFCGKIPIQILSPFWEWDNCPFITGLCYLYTLIYYIVTKLFWVFLGYLLLLLIGFLDSTPCSQSTKLCNTQIYTCYYYVFTLYFSESWYSIFLIPLKTG